MNDQNRFLFTACVLAFATSVTADEVQYMHTDLQGNVVAVTDETGAIVERYSYEPYGLPSDPTLDGPGYTGHVHDASSGLIYMQQRYYDPEIGRFLSVDPDPVDPATAWNFNRYNYAANNPYKFVDGDGRTAVAGAAYGCAATGPACPAGAVAGYLIGRMISIGIVAAVIAVNNEIGDELDSSQSAAEKSRDGTHPARGVSGKKGELEGTGGQSGADGAFDGVSGSNERSPKEGVRVKDLGDGGTIETHPSTKSPDYPQGTPTVKVRDPEGKVVETIRYPRDKPNDL